MFDVKSVIERLTEIGYEVKESDTFSLIFCVEKVRNTIKNETNCQDVPEGLEHIGIDMAVGKFLLGKKTFAPDDIAGLDLTGVVKEIREGDTTTSFGTGESTQTPEQRLTTYINYLLNYGKAEFSSYRRLKW